jgi:hypothetical protein
MDNNQNNQFPQQSTVEQISDQKTLVVDDSKSKPPFYKKKIFWIIIVAICVCLAVAGFIVSKMMAENRAIDKVQETIAAMGVIDLNSGPVIETAEKSINDLPDKLKERVENRDELVAAQEKYEQLKEAVDAIISEITRIGEVTIDSEAAITSAENGYERLGAASQKAVTNYSVLTDARTAYNELKAIETEKIRKEELKNTISMPKVWMSGKNSVGGFDVYVNFMNESTKTIKYVVFSVEFLNAVGDVVKDDFNYTQNTTQLLQDTGPYKAGQGRTGTAWRWQYWGWDIAKVQLIGVEIEYTDGAKTIISRDEIKYLK